MVRSQLCLDPSLAAPRWLLALCLAQAGRPKDALQELAQCRLAESRQVNLQAATALVLTLCGDKQKASSLLALVLRSPKQQITMTSLWGLVAVSLGEEAAAARLLHQAVQDRCGLAPFAWTLSGLMRHGQSAALASFQARMAGFFELKQAPIEPDLSAA